VPFRVHRWRGNRHTIFTSLWRVFTSGHPDTRILWPVAEALPLPSGVGVALVTFFAENGGVDLEATATRARRCVELGVSSVLVSGTTGEAACLSVEDRVELAAAVKEVAPGVPVVVGTGHPDADDAVEASARVAKDGAADALLVYCPEEAEPAAFYRAVRDVARGRPVLAYHFPVLAARELTTEELASLDVDGVKDSSGSSNRLADLVELGVRVYTGSATQLVLAGSCADGAILALANVAPTECIAAWNGDAAAQRRLFALHRQATREFPSYLKSSEPV
jgi:4-hydroxy-tetrahydrodipicolinate synthase